jgi:hypothetical protein
VVIALAAMVGAVPPVAKMTATFFLHKIGSQSWQPVELVLSPAVFDRDVLTFGIACLFQALAKCTPTLS